MFAEGCQAILASATRYVTWAAEYVKPVHNKDDKVRIKTLEDRHSSIFKSIQREMDFTLSKKERDTMTKAMILAGRTYGIDTAPVTTSNTWAGRKLYKCWKKSRCEATD